MSETTINSAPSTADIQEIVLLSPAAIAQIQTLLKDTNMAGMRLGVIGGGCAGLQYKLEPAETAIEGDLVQSIADFKLFIHPMSAAYLKGTQVDYVNTVMESGFRFGNPNASSTCGCGTSFGV